MSGAVKAQRAKPNPPASPRATNLDCQQLTFSSGTPNLWSHLTDEPLAEVLAAGHFNAFAGAMARHDLILVVASANDAEPECATLIVSKADRQHGVAVRPLPGVAAAIS